MCEDRVVAPTWARRGVRRREELGGEPARARPGDLKVTDMADPGIVLGHVDAGVGEGREISAQLSRDDVAQDLAKALLDFTRDGAGAGVRRGRRDFLPCHDSLFERDGP
jgi:hypothetical protein